MSKIKNYYPYDQIDPNATYSFKLSERRDYSLANDMANVTHKLMEDISTYVLTQPEIDEIDKALDTAIEAGDLLPQYRSRYFVGFIGEKLMEKFLGLKFCDTTFDKPAAYFMHHDIPDLGMGVKTVLTLKGGTEGFWMNALDFTAQQFIAYISYNHAKKSWVLDKVEKASNYQRILDDTDCTGRVFVVAKDREIVYEAPAPKRLF